MSKDLVGPQLSFKELQNKVEKLSRSEIKSVWFDVFGKDLDDDLPAFEKSDLGTKLLVRSRDRGLLDKLQESLSRESKRRTRSNYFRVLLLVIATSVLSILLWPSLQDMFTKPHPVEVDGFFRKWNENADDSMRQIYIDNKPEYLTGELKIALEHWDGKVYVLIPNGWDSIPPKNYRDLPEEEKKRYHGPVRVVPSSPPPKEKPDGGAKVRFHGRISDIRSPLGVTVVDAETEIIP